MKFSDFSFVPALQEGLDAMGFNDPTPIQEMAIPIILQGHDLVACAQTGTGKTAAYVLPVLDRIARSDHSHLNTLIIAPTRELAQQIDQQIEGFSYFLPVSSIPIYGGGDGMIWEQQKKALREGADMIIATPGRLLSMMGSEDVDFSHLQHLVLDEADRMLDMGFYEDIIRIIKMLPAKRQTMLFSATMPPRIRTMANKILNQPKEVSIAVSRPADKIRQEFYYINNDQKLPMTIDILKNPEYQSAIIFASTKENVKRLNIALQKAGLQTSAFHSDLEQLQREQLMRDFKSKKTKVLVGTDVLSRGIDVEGISLVLNFDVPPDPEDYIHRVGRTARAENSGVAITFVNTHDRQRFQRIEKLIGHKLEVTAVPENIGVSADVSAPVKSRRPQRKSPHKGNPRQNGSGTGKG
ncbi:MAG: DEAD/DEAH box helicase [Bacteroidetes bacterium]|jgi:ATP-dependent RNA helicase RhlE|nr:DEAD/DEAH box helicase [Bacteroidota bacterium]